MAESSEGMQAVMQPFEVTRVFDAPRELVFEAWTKPEHLKRWFHPKGFTTPAAESDPRPGGAFRIMMRSSEGEEFWSTGTYREVVSPERIVVVEALLDDENNPRVDTTTTVTFEDEGGKTRVTLSSRVDRILDPTVVPAVEGAKEGWTECLENLAEYLTQV
jgi:uncharacterized protein YndB with AHSA1/START domain